MSLEDQLIAVGLGKSITDTLIEIIRNEKKKSLKKKASEKEEEISSPFVEGFTTIPILLEKYNFLEINFVYKAVRNRMENGLDEFIIKKGKKCFVKEVEFISWYAEHREVKPVSRKGDSRQTRKGSKSPFPLDT